MEQFNSEAEEQILWQGRPAPRCYTFQYWKQALVGSTLFMVSSFWLLLAIELIGEGQPFWLAILPLPLIFGSFLFGPMQILIARLRWPKIYYQLTDKQLLLSGGKSVLLSDVVEIKEKKLGENLASFRVSAADSKPLILHCIEHPEPLTTLLRNHCPQL